MVTLKLEMFNDAGAHVQCNNAGHTGPFTFLFPDPSGTTNDSTNAPAANIDANGDLVFRVRVDNNSTVAQLPGVTAGTAHADDCGMLHYSSSTQLVTIDYVATHPNAFLNWNLSVVRGSHGQVAGASGTTSSLNPDHLVNAASVLLESCPQAAFAVNLYCEARAESGYGRQSQYGPSATIAFALITP